MSTITITVFRGGLLIHCSVEKKSEQVPTQAWRLRPRLTFLYFPRRGTCNSLANATQILFCSNLSMISWTLPYYCLPVCTTMALTGWFPSGLVWRTWVPQNSVLRLWVLLEYMSVESPDWPTDDDKAVFVTGTLSPIRGKKQNKTWNNHCLRLGIADIGK